MEDTTPPTDASTSASRADGADGGAGANCPPGSRFPLMAGVRSRVVQTPRLATHVYESGAPGGEPVVLVHGNASSARFFEQVLADLAGAGYYAVAPDLRGYGASEAKVVDATRGLRDYADDVQALVETLGLERFHLLGWSLGGCVVLQYTLDHPERVRSLTLQAAGSPFGYGGSQGAEGRPNYEDFAGSGGGLINPEVVARYVAKDDGAESPYAPRSGMRQFYVKPGFSFAPEWEDALVEQMLMMVIGDEYYPGDAVDSANWPFKGPGIYGSNNALSPKYCDLSGLGALQGGPPILWVRGADDQVVSDMALADPAALGQLGIIPGWPGAEVCPPQPMLTQLRAVLDRYAAGGGSYREEVLAECGHSPCIEHRAAFGQLFTAFMRAHAVEGQGGGAQAAADGGASAAGAVVAGEAAAPDTGRAGESAVADDGGPSEAMASEAMTSEGGPSDAAPGEVAGEQTESAQPVPEVATTAEPSAADAGVSEVVPAREPSAPVPPDTAATSAPGEPAAAAPEPAVLEPAVPEPALPAPAATAAPATPSAAEPQNRRGFFARLFGRRGRRG